MSTVNFTTFTGMNAELPPLNGPVEVGIAAGVDLSLTVGQRLILPSSDEKDKLVVQAGMNIGALAMVQSFSIMKREKKVNSDLYEFFSKCAYAVVMSRIIGEDSDIIWDGDDMLALNVCTLTPDESHKVHQWYKEMVGNSEIHKYMTAVLATKVNWYLINHHVGGMAMTGYLEKTMKAVFPELVVQDNIEGLTTGLRICGHWMSTVLAMEHLGVPNLVERKCKLPKSVPEVKVKLAADLELRKTAFPAGTAKLGVAVSIAKRIMRHTLFPFVPGPLEILGLAKVAKLVRADPILYHPGSYSASGRAQNRMANEAAEALIGRLGTFICVLYPNSSLCKAACIEKNKYKDYEDFSDAWFQLCVQYKRHSAVGTDVGKKILSSLMGSIAAGFAPKMDTDALNEFGVNQSDVDEAFARAKKAANVPAIGLEQESAAISTSVDESSASVTGN